MIIQPINQINEELSNPDDAGKQFFEQMNNEEYRRSRNPQAVLREFPAKNRTDLVTVSGCHFHQDYVGTNIISHQLMIMKYINDLNPTPLVNPTLVNQTESNIIPENMHKVITEFFQKMEKPKYKKRFDSKLEELRRSVEDENGTLLQSKISNVPFYEECIKRYDPSGLDPKDVINSLPLAKRTNQCLFNFCFSWILSD
ncbi:unnamed protein product [Adineta steineri]|uniref:Uncharacterized protein n=1 Tax=Adineta steineri TaxID=433720 RepID=A0A813QHR2_9BILA|nr:unnamed protein product [Adineta steineri]CAF3487685.1 unnamed protein product [Adineta steineri]